MAQLNIFQRVKQSVTTRQAASFYGLKVGRNDMCLCPFHDDRNPSMKVDARFHCFACNADGDVIDFVCNYCNYDLEFEDSYYLGEQLVVDGEPEITDTYIGDGPAFVSYRFTDIYGQEYWSDPIWLD